MRTVCGDCLRREGAGSEVRIDRLINFVAQGARNRIEGQIVPFS